MHRNQHDIEKELLLKLHDFIQKTINSYLLLWLWQIFLNFSIDYF